MYCMMQDTPPHTCDSPMKLLATYEDKDDGDEAAAKLIGEKRLASERDGTIVIYNLFGTPSWGNFLRLSLYNLEELQILLSRRAVWDEVDIKRHTEILAFLHSVAKSHGILIPEHWQ